MGKAANHSGLDGFLPPAGHAPDMHQTCTRRAPDMHQTWTRHAPDVHQTYTRHAPDVDQTCTRRGPDVDQTCTRHAPDVDQTCTRRGPDVHQTWTRRGPDMHQTWTRRAPDVDQTWTRHAPDVDQTCTRHAHIHTKILVLDGPLGDGRMTGEQVALVKLLQHHWLPQVQQALCASASLQHCQEPEGGDAFTHITLQCQLGACRQHT